MTHLINIDADMAPAHRLPPCGEKNETLIRRVAAAALSALDVECGCAVDVIYTDNEGIRRYNREYRDIDKATDVLSFPMLELPPGAPVEANDETVDIDTGLVFLGDIIISIERAGEQAAEYGHGIERELGYLTAHAMLHLLGYDHETESDRAIMREKEENIMASLSLTR